MDAKGASTKASALVIFGITGDLARRMTLPALYRLEARGQLNCAILGVGRGEVSVADLRARARLAVEQTGLPVDDVVFERLAERLGYVRGDLDDPVLYEAIREEIRYCGPPPLFYLETPPSQFAGIVHRLGHAGLTDGARVVIEKPFGSDLASARQLNRDIHEVLAEEQVFRIDHFLGKEPVQDIVYLRFANEIFEPVWNRKHVESVQIVMAEDFDASNRGAFYDAVGALRDVVQNHLLQVLALVAMEPPSGGRGAIADRRLDVFRAIPDADPTTYVRGQYRGYLDTPGVASGSPTETFAALRLEIDNWRWAGVPFFISAGKALAADVTEVNIRFRRPPDILMGEEAAHVSRHNHVTIRIGADAGARIGVLAKEAGADRVEPIHLDVSFQKDLEDGPTPYERLLGDAMIGDHTLFPREDVIEETWRIVQPLLDAPPPLEIYEPGSWGPEAAETLIRGHGGWSRPGSAIADD